MTDPLAKSWKQSRQGSHAGRGFHYQDAVATHIAILGWAGKLPIQMVIPEGHEDVSVQLTGSWIHVQAKSKRSHLGDFGIGEVVDFLVSAWTANEVRIGVQPDARVALILERSIRDLPTTGWDRPISDFPALATALRPKLLEVLNDPQRVQALLANTSVIEVGEPRERCLVVLSEQLGIPRGACQVHYEALKERLAELADQNGARPVDSPAQFSIGDVQRVLDESTALVDLEALDAAINRGICEVADFQTPIYDERFFEGVDVKPGHIVAGLPVERPELVEEITQALQRHRAVLIAGPSGAGKSAAAWLAAYASRHLIRWYRVKQLGFGDVELILRTIRAARPSEQSPVGLVVDDLGRGDREGWDTLVEEAAFLKGVRLLGIVREENLSLVNSVYACHQIHPVLDDSLASRIWEELRSSDTTTWEDWREPCEQANGLLLEYGYLLTTGERLINTVTAQIEQRIREERDLELRVLRLIAAADVWGAAMEINGLRRAFDDVCDEDLRRALLRLVGEHLVQETSTGVFAGLHQVRSRHILMASHSFGIPLMAETICQTLIQLDGPSLQSFLSGVLTDGVVADEAVLACLSDRLRGEPDPALLIAAFHALRLVSFRRMASEWVAILEEAGVPPSNKIQTVEFALAGVTNESFLPSIQAAIERLTATSQEDLRLRLLELLGDSGIRRFIERVDDIQTATAILTVLSGLPSTLALTSQLRSLDSVAHEAPLEDLALFLSSARAVDLDLARYFVDSVGGPGSLLERTKNERSWVRDLRLNTDAEGRQVVEGEVLRISESIQPDVHADVVALCKLVIALIPDADIAACRAVDVSGALAGYGDFKFADKRIPRHRLPSDAEIAWNRVRVRLVAAMLATPTATQRLVAESSLLNRLANALALAANSWCRNSKFPQSVARELDDIAAQIRSLPPAPLTRTNHQGPLDPVEVVPLDPVESLLAGAIQAVKQLLTSGTHYLTLAAFIHDTLLNYANTLVDTPRWRLLSDPPQVAIQRIRRTLVDLHAVVAEHHFEGKAARVKFAAAARRNPSSNVLGLCADIARESAQLRLEGKIQKLTEDLGRRGYVVQAFHRQSSRSSGVVWPNDEVAVLVELPTVIDWLRAQPDLVLARNLALEPTRRVVAAPTRGGKAVDELSGNAQSEFYPLPHLLTDWKTEPPLEFVDEHASAQFSKAYEAIAEISVIAGSGKSRINSEENSALIQASERFLQAREELVQLAASDADGVVEWAFDFLNILANQVQEQLNANSLGQPNTPVVGIELTAPQRGEDNETVRTAGLIRLSLIEYDIEPVGVGQRLEAALQRLGS